MKHYAKTLSCLLALLLSIAMLVGCGSSTPAPAADKASTATETKTEEAPKTEEPAPAPAADTKVNETEVLGDTNAATEVTVQFWGAAEEKQVWLDILAPLENVKITFNMIDWPTYWQKLQTQIAGGTVADVFGMRNLELPGYAKRGSFLPLDDYMNSNPDYKFDDFFGPEILDSMKYEGQTYVLPYDFGPILLFYNKDQFDKYGVEYPNDSWTWDDLVAAAKKMTNEAENDYGFAMEITGGWYVGPALSFGVANGAEYRNDAGQITINSQPMIDAMQYWADAINVEKAAPSAETLAAGGTNALSDRWYAGHIAMKLDGPWSLIGTKSNSKFNFDVAVMPKAPTGKRLSPSAGSGFGVFANTKVPEEAKKVVCEMTKSDALKVVAKAGRGFPARKSAVDSFYEAAGIENLKTAMDMQLNEAFAIVSTTNWNEAETFINQNILQPVYFGQAKAADIMNQYAEQVAEMSAK